jgi:hypothetical protein
LVFIPRMTPAITRETFFIASIHFTVKEIEVFEIKGATAFPILFFYRESLGSREMPRKVRITESAGILHRAMSRPLRFLPNRPRTGSQFGQCHSKGDRYCLESEKPPRNAGEPTTGGRRARSR